MKQAHEELQRQLSALRARFAEMGQQAAAAAEAMVATVVPEAELVDALVETGRAFVQVRRSLLEQAAPLSPIPDLASLTSLAHLERVLHEAIEAEEERLRQAAWDLAREKALATLDRVLALIHREDSAFAGLVACQAKAREMHMAISADQPENLEEEVTIVSGRVRPFADLVALVDGWNVLDDDRCAFLQDTIAQSFGRGLALAALRGKLGNDGEASAPEPTRAPVARVATATPPAPEPVEPVMPEPAERVSFAAADPEPNVIEETPEPPAPVVAAHAPAPAALDLERPTAAAARSVEASPSPPPVPAAPRRPSAQPVVTSPPSSTGAQIRLAGNKVQVETSEEQHDREASLEAMAVESAHWWVGARKGWNEFRASGASFSDAAKDALERHPYLLSVPIQKSAEHADGRLAEGYALLLEHVEKQEEGFVKEALTRLNPQFTTRGKDETYQLGQELYLYVVAEGRLYKTYPDFVKEVMSRVIPEPGLWVQGGLTEGETGTASFMRIDPAGTEALKQVALTDDKERAAPQLFTATLGPLTARFFKAEAGELADPPDVDIKLKENDAPSDRAWIVSVPMTGKPEAPKRHKAGGTVVPELGKQHRVVWIGVFNPDPNNDKSYELAITLKRKPRAAAAAAATFVPPKPSPFAPRKR